jgi:hypothetical protein
MPFIRKCPKCGLDLIDPSDKVCPMCGLSLAAASRKPLWIIAALQICVASAFMLLFHFPKWMIPAFAGMILVGTLTGSLLKPQNATAPRSPQPAPSRPLLFRVVGLGIAVSFLGCVCFGLFGFVIFMNSWNDWHRYEGQPYHVTTFRVTQVYYQKLLKGGRDFYASGTVDGEREWMSLEPYLHTRPRNLAEVEERVPVGTSIPIYLFPKLKGRSRLRVYEDTPPAEAYHRTAINAVNYGLMGFAISGALLFILNRARRLCFVGTDAAVQAVAPSRA